MGWGCFVFGERPRRRRAVGVREELLGSGKSYRDEKARGESVRGDPRGESVRAGPCRADACGGEGLAGESPDGWFP